VVSGGQALVEDTEDGRTELVTMPSFDAPFTEAHRYFLGTDTDGVRYFAVQKDSLPGRMDEVARPAGLREAGALLGDRDAELLVHAVALENWQRMHRFCSRCGERTDIAAAGHVRRCPACGAEHYPRTDPAVIMLVTDEKDRALLGRQLHWPVGRYSTLAGFVEPGESIEEAVRREAFEEAGVQVGPVEYVASQPWPFPSSLMLGFMARADSPEIRVDGDEIEEARWFSREELRAAFESGEVLPPSGISIAARLVELWYGEPLPTP
jgi:NAD+ diphosphatase